MVAIIRVMLGCMHIGHECCVRSPILAMKLPIQFGLSDPAPTIAPSKKSCSWRQLPHCIEMTSFPRCLLLFCSWHLSRDDEFFFHPTTSTLYVDNEQSLSFYFFHAASTLHKDDEQSSSFFFLVASIHGVHLFLVLPKKRQTKIFVSFFLFLVPSRYIEMAHSDASPNLKDSNVGPKVKQQKKKRIGAHSLTCSILGDTLPSSLLDSR